MPRGGNRRAMRYQQHPDPIRVGALLWAIEEAETPRAILFKESRTRLLNRHRRTVAALAAAGAPALLGSLGNWLPRACSPVQRPYPPITATAEDHEVIAAAQRHVSDLVSAEFPDRDASPQELQLFDQLHERFVLPVLQERGLAQKTRTSRRTYARRFLEEVKDFGESFDLRAVWLVPAIVLHFLAAVDPEGDYFDPFSDFVFPEAHSVPQHQFSVQLPGTELDWYRTDDRLLRGRLAMRALPIAGSARTLFLRPTAAQIHERASEIGSSAAVVAVRTENEFADARALVEAEVERLRGDALSDREVRALRRHLDPQLRTARDERAGAGYTSPRADSTEMIERHAKWVAFRILEPAWSWKRISDKTQVDDDRSVRRACTAFAELIDLRLPERGTFHSR